MDYVKMWSKEIKNYSAFNWVNRLTIKIRPTLHLDLSSYGKSWQRMCLIKKKSQRISGFILKEVWMHKEGW